ncbi:MAG: site-specific integrase [Comamonas sp.]|jgi:integrase|uniref:site-specific integrase n=1 Tax=Comamonas sp. TaxID=34028 RepID=UPI00282D607D|nr:site-specific integrase [Comamonas sp.]MDR0215952.1 site-specific integrase [Comamonas sp.]
MAGKKQFPNGTWQYVFKKAGLLAKPIYLTFATEEEGDEYAKRLEALLARGIVPTEHQRTEKIMTIAELVREYERDAHPSPKDRGSLNTIVPIHGYLPLTEINAAWVDNWIQTMKRIDKVAPTTIQAKVGALARCTDWGMRKGFLTMPDHALRSLPNGYAQYTKADEAAAGVAREDTERDRRLEPGEWEKILEVIAAGVLPRKQRPLLLEGRRDKAALKCIAVLAVESAMRLRELFTLTWSQVDMTRKTVFLDKTKNGDKRQVPLSSVAQAELAAFRPADAGPDALVFPFLEGEGTPRVLHATTDFLSKLFIEIFELAGAEDLGFHDLRHEATSRLFERTKLTDTQIMKITGHKSQRMLMRYANLRGSTLADALW